MSKKLATIGFTGSLQINTYSFYKRMRGRLIHVAECLLQTKIKISKCLEMVILVK